MGDGMSDVVFTNEENGFSIRANGKLVLHDHRKIPTDGWVTLSVTIDLSDPTAEVVIDRNGDSVPTKNSHVTYRRNSMEPIIHIDSKGWTG